MTIKEAASAEAAIKSALVSKKTGKPATVETPKKLTIAQVATAFGVSTVAIFNWRNGTTTRTAMPVLSGTKPMFSVAAVQKWGAKYGLQFVAQWEKKILQVAAKKTGPKVKAGNEEKKIARISKATKKKPKH